MRPCAHAGDSIVMIGGRTSPSAPLSDVWLLQPDTWTWRPVRAEVLHAGTEQQQQQGWPGRYRHTAVCDASLLAPPMTAPPTAAKATPLTPSSAASATPLTPSAGSSALSIAVFGGRNADSVLRDLWVLRAPVAAPGHATAPVDHSDAGHDAVAAAPPSSTSTSSASSPDPSQPWTWVQVTPEAAAAWAGGSGTAPAAAATTTAAATASQPGAAPACAWPSPRKSHAAAALAGRMYVHGGTAAYGGQLGECWPGGPLHFVVSCSI